VLETTTSPLGSAPWERQRGESSIAYACFRHFLDAGDLRQLRSTAEAMHRSERLIQRWAHDYRWHDRVLAWDQYTARLDAAEQRQKVKAMRRKHAGLASALLDKVRDAINGLDPEDLSAGNVIKMLEKGALVERLALEGDLPTQTPAMPDVTVNVGIDNRQVHIDQERAELAEYLNAHPEKIPTVVKVIESLIQNPPELSTTEKNVTPSDG